MTPLTYKLDINGSASATYYPAVKTFTDTMLAHAEPTITPIAKKYRNFLIGYRLEEPRSLEEYVFELLNLGILWRTYGSTARSVTVAPFHLMARMGEWRKTHPRWKPMIDQFRGIVLSLFLAPKQNGHTDDTPCCLNDLEQLVTWLEATGDFREDAFRYIRWLGYFGTLPEHFVPGIMEKVLSFADWFEMESAIQMGSFTPNVDSFIGAKRTYYKWREDRFSCLRSRSEYHLNMVGAEILNRAFRKEFTACSKRTVLLPGCMRAKTAEECEGVSSKKGITCSGCEPSCRVNQLREMGIRHNFEVMVIPHSTDLAQWKVAPGEQSSAVVGVACLAVLVQGGWELKRNNVPAQCVLLNECGCKKHWHDQGIPTALDVRELKRIVTH